MNIFKGMVFFEGYFLHYFGVIKSRLIIVKDFSFLNFGLGLGCYGLVACLLKRGLFMGTSSSDSSSSEPAESLFPTSISLSK